MLSSLIAIMSSSAAGSIIGGGFGWLNRREDRRLSEAEMKHKIDLAYARTEANIKEVDAKSFLEAQKSTGKFGDAAKAIVRPIITGILLFMTWSILQRLEILTGGIVSLPEAEAVALYREITLNIVSLTATAVSFWFSSRGSYRRK